MHIVSPLSNTNVWNHSDVTVILGAQDNEGGSGVKDIRYSATGARYLQELWIGFRSRGDLLLASFYQFSISEPCSCPDQRHRMRSG